MSYLAKPLTAAHKRKHFECGQPALDHYIRIQVSQDIRRRLAACFVTADEHDVVTGFYTLSSASIPMTDAPEGVRKKMPGAYSGFPVTLLGRLAVDTRVKGQRLGERLLIDALKRSHDLSGTIASGAVVVDPIDDGARAFYEHYAFVGLESGKMFILMKTIEMLMR